MPELIGFGLIFGPVGLLAAELNRRVGLEIDGLLEQLLHLGDALVHPFGVEIINFVGWFQIAQKNVIVECGAIFRIERIDILLREKEMTVIEQLEISLEKFSRQFVVELLLRVTETQIFSASAFARAGWGPTANIKTTAEAASNEPKRLIRGKSAIPCSQISDRNAR